SLVIAGGILFVAVVWPVMQWGVWYRLDERAADGLNDWIFAIAHLLFGLAVAGMASIGIADADYSRRARALAGRPPPAAPPGRAARRLGPHPPAAPRAVTRRCSPLSCEARRAVGGAPDAMPPGGGPQGE